MPPSRSAWGSLPSTGNYKSEGLELSRGALLAVDETMGAAVCSVVR